MTDFQCRFCNKAFVRERTLSSHVCEKKRRSMNKDDPASRIGFNVWVNFMKYVSPMTKKEKTYDDFIKSVDYIGFIKFANYLIELKPVECEKFTAWLFKMGVRLSDWQKPGTYQLYIQEDAKKETAERALERTIIVMSEWGETTNNSWQEFFVRVAPATAMNMIVMGRISPWVIFSTDAAQILLDRMEPGQLNKVAEHIDTSWWKNKLKNQQIEVQWMNTMLSLAIDTPS